MAKRSTKPPKSASERATDRRADLIKQGWAQKNWLLPPAALADLAALTERDGSTEAEAVAKALRVARDRKAEPTNAELAAMVSRRLKAAS